MLNKLKKNNKKGFTLVELIVVLVILAILAALLIPALTGYIDKAKERQIIAETRQVVMATQTLSDELYGTYALGKEGDITVGNGATDIDNNIIGKDDIAKLAEVAAGNIGDITIGKQADADGMNAKVKEAKYTAGGKTCTYTKTKPEEAGTYKVAPTVAPAP